MNPKLKTCKAKGCGKEFMPFTTTQKACSPECALSLVRAKEYKKTTIKLKRKYYDNDKKHWKKKAKTACHTYIRERDRALGCIQCGKEQAAQWDAGHFKTRGARSEIQFHWANINKQCSVCNNHSSANDGRHRENLLARVGSRMVEHLELDHPHHKWTLEDYKGVHWWYTVQLKELKGE